jgi:hypothetical protein
MECLRRWRMRNEGLLSGAVGAAAVTLAHQVAKAKVPGAPRMDVVGMRALRCWVPGAKRLTRRGQYRAALAGELLANTGYYALVALSRSSRPLAHGALLGAVVGLGGVYLTPALGLGRRPVHRRARTAWLTFGMYLLGGLAAGAATGFFRRWSGMRGAYRPGEPVAWKPGAV